ncbi:jg27912 [Pararge aegeria aegeria]|uniref:Jg27912 protein n=1 Tax=Pararge aegeria aegeria TaxID=348720 RepID=A0A8S4RT38_9NEOP|nr:jg27912 [Pararge aegeria aegeria]
MTSGESLGVAGGKRPRTEDCGTPYKRPMSSCGRPLVEVMRMWELSHKMEWRDLKETGNDRDIKIRLLILKIQSSKPKYDKKQIGRQNYETLNKNKKFKKADIMIQREHYEKMRQIISFMSSHMLTTNYFYDEVQRIIKDREVQDELRRMVSYLEKPKNADIKKSIL